jgi:DNA-binding MarR family transcriptional regulator
MMVLSRYYLPVARKSTAPERAVAELIEQVGRSAYTDAFIGGLNPAQWATLRYVGRANRFSRTVCAFALFHGTTRGTASQTVKALVEKGYLRRRPVKGDRRSFRLELTVRARRFLTQDPFQDLVNAAGALSAAGRSTVTEGLQVMLESLLMERGRPLFGVCASCRHLRDRGRFCESSAACECGLLGEPLSEEELTEICVNYEPNEVSQALASR